MTPERSTSDRNAALLRSATSPLFAGLIAAGCVGNVGKVGNVDSTDSATAFCPTDSGEGCADPADRVDLYTPTFSNPTEINNVFYPLTGLESVVFIGHVDGKPFRTETTILPETKMIEWNGQSIETIVQQLHGVLRRSHRRGRAGLVRPG